MQNHSASVSKSYLADYVKCFMNVNCFLGGENIRTPMKLKCGYTIVVRASKRDGTCMSPSGGQMANYSQVDIKTLCMLYYMNHSVHSVAASDVYCRFELLSDNDHESKSAYKTYL